MRLGLALGVSALGLAFAGIAQAGTVTYVNGELHYQAGPGETNRVYVVSDDMSAHVIDLGASFIAPGGPCESEGPTEAFCTIAPIKQARLRLTVFTDDQDDYVNLSGATYSQGLIEAGAGEDELIGGAGINGDTYDGGLGADVFHGRGTVDYHVRTNPVTVTLGDNLANDGEPGENDLIPNEIDRVVGGQAGDTMTTLDVPEVGHTALVGEGGVDHLAMLKRGGHGWLEGNLGSDVLESHARHGVVHGGYGDDLLLGGDGAQALWGERGENDIRGRGGNDRLIGGSGVDEISCGPGHDDASGGHGNDMIFSRDGERDLIDGGAGKADRARVDAGLDRVLRIEELL